ncbi:MAG: hypothetical protein EOM55_04245 [Clostridia bacterium]|nr:hypothetical protein [Clostridia bacterium]
MKNLSVKISGTAKQNNLVFIDDKEVKLNKNSFGSYSYDVQTEKDSVNIKIKSILEINSKMWFLTNIFFFIISIFGIFDYRLPKKCLSISFETNVKLKNEQNDISISLLTQQVGKPCAEIKTECGVEEIKNFCEQNIIALKRLKTLRITKIFLWIALIVAVVALFSMGIF